MVPAVTVGPMSSCDHMLILALVSVEFTMEETHVHRVDHRFGTLLMYG